jgi:hypothetical protein
LLGRTRAAQPWHKRGRPTLLTFRMQITVLIKLNCERDRQAKQFIKPMNQMISYCSSVHVHHRRLSAFRPSLLFDVAFGVRAFQNIRENGKVLNIRSLATGMGPPWSRPDNKIPASRAMPSVSRQITTACSASEHSGIDRSKLRPLRRNRSCILVACGSFNPPTLMHLRMFEAAKYTLEKVGY